MEGRKTFSVASNAYARSRPQYPRELFAWLACECVVRDRAWDCATGNGQAALGLASYFASVEATDISPQQIEHGFSTPNISYSVQSAEETTFPEGSFDLVAAAQALHWFDLKRFWAEVWRTSKPGAFFCAWGYAWFECDPELKVSLFSRGRNILEPYWASENHILWRGYRSKEIVFPFRRIEAPSFKIDVRWDINEILDHVRSWSAYKRAIADAEAAQSLARIEEDAAERFKSSGRIPLTAPLYIVAGRVP